MYEKKATHSQVHILDHWAVFSVGMLNFIVSFFKIQYLMVERDIVYFVQLFNSKI